MCAPYVSRVVRNWADVFDSRLFSSYVVQASNVRNERIEDYLPAGR